jgi:hypothetical protein
MTTNMHSKICAKCELSLLCTSVSRRTPRAIYKCDHCGESFAWIGTTKEKSVPAMCPIPYQNDTMICRDCHEVAAAFFVSFKFKAERVANGDAVVRLFSRYGDNPQYQLAGDLRLRRPEWVRLKYALQKENTFQEGKFDVRFEEVQVNEEKKSAN